MGNSQGAKSATTEVLCFQRRKESPPLRQFFIFNGSFLRHFRRNSSRSAKKVCCAALPLAGKCMTSQDPGEHAQGSRVDALFAELKERGENSCSQTIKASWTATCFARSRTKLQIAAGIGLRPWRDTCMANKLRDQNARARSLRLQPVQIPKKGQGSLRVGTCVVLCGVELKPSRQDSDDPAARSFVLSFARKVVRHETTVGF